MPDITMCKDNQFPKRHDCWRYTTVPSEALQSYFMSSPRIGDECDYFSEVEKGMTPIPPNPPPPDIWTDWSWEESDTEEEIKQGKK